MHGPKAGPSPLRRTCGPPVALRQVLEDEGVLRWVDVGECQIDLVPFDKDLLSLELDASFKASAKYSTH
jgi:hypothetical protein